MDQTEHIAGYFHNFNDTHNSSLVNIQLFKFILFLKSNKITEDPSVIYPETEALNFANDLWQLLFLYDFNLKCWL